MRRWFIVGGLMPALLAMAAPPALADDATPNAERSIAAAVPGDVDGDGRTDIGVYRDGRWIWADGPTVDFGLPGHIAVPADYDGDGRSDVTVWDPTSGGWLAPAGGPSYFGVAGDVPVPGDYDGDGAAELAVWRPSTGAWFVRGQGDPSYFGVPGDVPVPGDYDGRGRVGPSVYRPGVGAWLTPDQAAVYHGGQPGDRPLSLPWATWRHLINHATPASPDALRATATGGDVHLSWEAVAESDVVGYRVYRSPAQDGPWTELTAEPTPTSSWTVADIGETSAWWFTVTAVDRAGTESARSDPARVPESEDLRIAGLTPAGGPLPGNNDVVIKGSGLEAASRVLFGDVEAEIVERSEDAVTVRAPAHVAGTVVVHVEDTAGNRVEAASRYEYRSINLEPQDAFTPAAGTVVLDPSDVQSVESPPTGSLTLTLAPGAPSVGDATWLYLRPGHRDARTGLAARVSEVETVAGVTVVDVRRAPLDQVLPQRSFAMTGQPAEGEPDRVVAMRVATSTAAATSAGGKMMSVNRTWLDCRRVVQHENGTETLEPVPETTPVDVQVLYTIEDLEANVIDRTEGSYYEASLSGTPTLKIVAKSAVSAKCEILPSLVQKLKATIPVGPFELTIAPAVNVTFDVVGSVVVTKRSPFIVGLRKSGDQDATYFEHVRHDPATIHSTAKIGVSVEVGVKFTLLYHRVVGLGLQLGLGAGMDATLDAASGRVCTTLTGSIGVDVTAELQLLFFSWTQPLLDFTWELANETDCSDQALDPAEEVVLDPGADSNPTEDYQIFPSTYSTEFEPGTFEPVNYGDAYILRRDITLEAGHKYWFNRTLSVPEGVTVTVEPGAHIKLGHCYWTVWLPAGPCLNVSGGLVAFNGTSDEPVVIARLSDDSVDGDTDGVPPDRSMSGVAPMSVGAGVLTMRHVDLRTSGLNVSGGAVTLNSSRLVGGLTSTGAAVSLDRVQVEGSLILNAGRGSVRRSRVDGGEAGFSGSWLVDRNQFLRSEVVIGTEDVVLTNNALGEGASMRADAMGAAGTIVGTTTQDGQPPVVEVRGGTVAGDVAWTAPVTYVLSSPVVVPVGAALTLGPGTVVKGQTTYNVYQSFPSYFQVDGTLRTQGTASRRVVLTARNDLSAGANTYVESTQWMNGEQWAGIQVGEQGRLLLAGTDVDRSTRSTYLAAGTVASLDDVRFGGSAHDGALVTASDDLTIAHSAFPATGRALVLQSGDPVVVATEVAGALEINTPAARLEDVVLGAHGVVSASPDGAGAQVDVRGGDGSPAPVTVSRGALQADATWGPGTYVITDVRVPVGVTLALAPGTVVKGWTTYGYGGSSSRIFVQGGTLRAEGTSADPVVFTSARGAAGAEIAGRDDPNVNYDLWGGITVDRAGDESGTGGAVVMNHVKADAAQQLLQLGDGVTADLAHLDVVAGSWDPVLSSWAARLRLSDSTFASHHAGAEQRLVSSGGSDARLDRNLLRRGSVTVYDGSVVLRDNRFLETDGIKLENQGDAGVVVDARHNWWGGPYGPVDAVPPQVSGNVDVVPWCTTEACA